MDKVLFRNYKPQHKDLEKYVEITYDIKDELRWVNELSEGLSNEAKNINPFLEKSFKKMDGKGINDDLKRYIKPMLDKAAIETNQAIFLQNVSRKK